MNTNGLKLAALATALALTAGCAKKKPAELPPPPAASTEAVQPSGETASTGTVGNAPLPGSRADFLQSVRSDTVYFDTDSYSIDEQDRAILDQQAQWLLAHPNVHVTIEGHCDERGTREYNLALGERRANAAKNYLAAKGVPTSRMTTISWGKERPVALGSNEEAWAQNRRAVTVVPA